MENKVLKREYVGIAITLEHCISDHEIEDLEFFLKQLKNSGATHFEIEIEKEWDGDVTEIKLEGVKVYFESDEERDERIKKEQERAAEQQRLYKEKVEAEERRTLRILKEKYEGKN